METYENQHMASHMPSKFSPNLPFQPQKNFPLSTPTFWHSFALGFSIQRSVPSIHLIQLLNPALHCKANPSATCLHCSCVVRKWNSNSLQELVACTTDQTDL